MSSAGKGTGTLTFTRSTVLDFTGKKSTYVTVHCTRICNWAPPPPSPYVHLVSTRRYLHDSSFRRSSDSPCVNDLGSRLFSNQRFYGPIHVSFEPDQSYHVCFCYNHCRFTRQKLVVHNSGITRPICAKQYLFERAMQFLVVEHTLLTLHATV